MERIKNWTLKHFWTGYNTFEKLFMLFALETKQEFIDDVRRNYGYNRLKEFKRSVYNG